MYELVRTDEEISELFERIWKEKQNGTAYAGMTYEDGLRYALDWLTDKDEPFPFD